MQYLCKANTKHRRQNERQYRAAASRCLHLKTCNDFRYYYFTFIKDHGGAALLCILCC